MEISINGRWMIPFKKFGMATVKTITDYMFNIITNGYN